MSLETNDIDMFTDAIVGALVKVTGPFGDFVRAIYAAQTDALVDMRSKLIIAGWTEDLANQMVLATVSNMAKAWENVGKQLRKERD